jgi:hypothetical protein
VSMKNVLKFVWLFSGIAWLYIQMSIWQPCSCSSSSSRQLHTVLPSSKHSTYCTWLERRRLLLWNITRVPPSLQSYHSTLLLRWRLVACTIHSVPLMLTSDIVDTDLG